MILGIICSVLVLINLTTATTVFSPSEEEICFSRAFSNLSWVQCVTPIISEIQGEFNVTKMCLIGEMAAMHCLMEKMTECFDILVFAGLAPEQAATIDLSPYSTAELVDMTCELYKGECDGLSSCDGSIEEDVPLVEAVQTVVLLCGPQCVHTNRATCPSLVNFYYTSTFQNFTTTLNVEMTERTRMFVDGQCLNASHFDADCVVNQLKSTEFQLCYDDAMRNYPSPAGIMSCPFYKSVHSCMAGVITPTCGEASAILVREATLLTIPEIPDEICLQSINAGLRAPVSIVFFTILTFIQIAITSLLF